MDGIFVFGMLIAISHNINILILSIMKHSTKKHTIAGRSNSGACKPQKHDANLQKNSALYFQIGLIVCLLVTYGLLEMKFQTNPIEITSLPPINDVGEIEIKNFKEFKEDVKPEVPIKNVQKLGTKDPIIKPDDFEGMEIAKVILSEPATTNSPVDPGSIKVEKVPEDIPIPWVNLEKVPVYPGCESSKTNDQRTKCMSSKLAKLVQDKFNQDLFSELGLYGIQKIHVQFKIDKKGNITEIKARSPYIQLENEALRVANKIPNMEPGMQRANPVSVIYDLPILLKAQ